MSTYHIYLLSGHTHEYNYTINKGVGMLLDHLPVCQTVVGTFLFNLFYPIVSIFSSTYVVFCYKI